MTVKSLFDSAATTYDRARRQLVPCFDDFYGTALEVIPFPSDAAISVLDLGAGTGLLASFVAAAFPRAELTLVDISEEMLGRARERFAATPARVCFEVLDFGQAPLPPAMYDLVVSALAIHHLEDEQKQALFRRVYATLRTGGAFINAEQVHGATPAVEQRFQATWHRKAVEKGASAEDIEQAIERMRADRTATLADQLRWLEAAGFRDVDCFYKYYRFAVYAGFK
jgi:tRNA (cmo5U34)-methyltransferase